MHSTFAVKRVVPSYVLGAVLATGVILGSATTATIMYVTDDPARITRVVVLAGQPHAPEHRPTDERALYSPRACRLQINDRC
jgi:hypothetical protein